jgi:hypothetical protein
MFSISPAISASSFASLPGRTRCWAVTVIIDAFPLVVMIERGDAAAG